MMLNEEPSLELVKRTDEVSLNRVKRQKREAEEELQRVSPYMPNRMDIFILDLVVSFKPSKFNML